MSQNSYEEAIGTVGLDPLIGREQAQNYRMTAHLLAALLEDRPDLREEAASAAQHLAHEMPNEAQSRRLLQPSGRDNRQRGADLPGGRKTARIQPFTSLHPLRIHHRLLQNIERFINIHFAAPWFGLMPSEICSFGYNPFSC